MLASTRRRIWPSTLLCGGIVALSFLLPLPQHDKILGFPSPCLLQRCFHLPCPACGLTRAFVATAHGHIGEALKWHPLGPLLFGLTLAYTLWSLRASMRGDELRVSPRIQLTAGLSLALVMVVFWGLRLAGYFPLAPT